MGIPRQNSVSFGASITSLVSICNSAPLDLYVPPAVPHFQYTCFVDLESYCETRQWKGEGPLLLVGRRDHRTTAHLGQVTAAVRIILTFTNVPAGDSTDSGVPRNFFLMGGRFNKFIEDRKQRKRGSGGDSPLVRCSGGSCNLVREISFRIVKFS